MRLGRGMAALASLFDPEMILLAGGASAACDLLIPVLSEALNRWASPLARGVPIEQAALAERAAVYGAIRLAQAGTLDM